jgi:hypothetical protein
MAGSEFASAVRLVILGAIVGMQRNLHTRVEAGLLFPPRSGPGSRCAGISAARSALAVTWHGIELLASNLRFDFHGCNRQICRCSGPI